VLFNIFFFIIATKVVSKSDEEHVTTLHLEDILVFVTGADLIPPMGFDRAPEIFFYHTSQLKLAVASTWSPSITLPTCHDSYKNFKDAMVESIVSGLWIWKGVDCLYIILR